MALLRLSAWLAPLLALVLTAAACAPAAPAPTAPPPKPTEAPKPTAGPTEAPRPAEKAAETPAAATSPAPKVEAKPGEKPAAKVETKALEDFYKGKTIRLIVGAGVGGGYDTYSRLIARHIGRYIPGSPTVVVENMAGGGSLLATNHVFNVAPRDGTTLLSMQGTVVSRQLFGDPGVQFDINRLHFLGAPTQDNYLLLVTRKSGFTDLAEAIGPNARQLVLGGDAPGNALEDSANLTRNVLGANIKVVSGYDGTAKVRLAMESGEVDGMGGWSWESFRTSSLDRVQSGEWLILVQFTEQPLKDLPNVPMIMKYAQADEQRQLFRFGLINPGKFARPYVVHGEVPAERVAVLQEAFAKALADSELLAEAEKAKLDISPLTGADLRRMIGEYMGMSADTKARLQAALKPAGR